MRLILILMISFWTLSVAGQIEPISKKDAKVTRNPSIRNQKALTDTIPQVIYIKSENEGLPTAFYINGELSNSSILKTIDPELIDSIYVEKKEIEIDDEMYDGQIYIRMKEAYQAKLVSLTDLRSKYVKPTNRPVIFVIDNDIVKGNYNTYLVDEKFILKIMVDHMEIEEEKLDVEIIRLVTKSEENRRKSETIMIRGIDTSKLNEVMRII